MNKYDYLIVGAGLYGATFARIMTDRGYKCLVIEKRSHIGGNCYCEKFGEINVHKYGAHIFHTDNKLVWEFLNKYCEFNNFINSPLAYYKGKIYHMPFNMNTFYELLGTITPDKAKIAIEKEIASEKIVDINNLENKAISMVGRTIYETLVKGYTEKQWNKPCRELPSSIINRLPLRFTYDNKYFSDRYQGIPIGGYNVLFEGLLNKIDVAINTDYFDDRDKYDKIADKIVYTGAIDKFYDYKYGALEYRSLKFDTEKLDINDYQGNAVVNYTEACIPYTRIIEHKHFETTSRLNTDYTVITREYPHNYEKGYEPFYPINDLKNNKLFELYKQEASNNEKVIFGGRLAEYKYYDMDDTVAAAITLCNSIK